MHFNFDKKKVQILRFLKKKQSLRSSLRLKILTLDPALLSKPSHGGFRSSIPFTSNWVVATNSRALPGNFSTQHFDDSKSPQKQKQLLLKNDASKQKQKVTTIWQMLQQFYFYDIYIYIFIFYIVATINCSILQYSLKHEPTLQFGHSFRNQPAAPDKHHHSIRLNIFGQFGATSWK